MGKEYFKHWNNHDIDELKKLFTPKIELRDWDNEFIGIESVIDENKNIFKSFPNIFAEIILIVQSQNIVIIQIVVHLSSEESIDVIDVLEVEENKINKIRAYKG
ncbi:nuclear transport factor 2 family protein [Acidimicrobiia bacterium]|nr:nuclear transport factor 2 family protein [Acidimicrobiia bacterium]